MMNIKTLLKTNQREFNIEGFFAEKSQVLPEKSHLLMNKRLLLTNKCLPFSNKRLIMHKGQEHRVITQ